MTQSFSRTMRRLMDQSGGVSTQGGEVLDRKTRRIMEKRRAAAEAKKKS